MQEIYITRIIGALEGFLESSLFLEKQHLNTIAELFIEGSFYGLSFNRYGDSATGTKLCEAT